MKRSLSTRLTVLAALATTSACPGFDPSEQEDLRSIRLTLVPPNSQDEALGGTRPVQLAALRVEAGILAEVRVGTAVDPRTTQTLSVGLPKTGSWTLTLQTPRGGTGSLGQLVARVLWPTEAGVETGRLVEGPQDLTLGSVAFETGSPSTLADNVVRVAVDRNPASITDRDGDGTPDLRDTDMDGDGVNNDEDEDADGDGLQDAGQDLGSLPDRNNREDGDGVPDDLE